MKLLRNYSVKVESRLKAGDEFGRNSAQAICFIGMSQIQQARLSDLLNSVSRLSIFDSLKTLVSFTSHLTNAWRGDWSNFNSF